MQPTKRASSGKASTAVPGDAAIRNAVAADATLLSAMIRKTFAAASGHRSTPANVAAYLDQVCSPDRQHAEIDDPDMLTLIVEATPGADWAGFAQLHFGAAAPVDVELARPVELARIYLAPEFHGQGLGSRLLQRLCDEARSRGSDGIWLSVWQNANQAIEFYTDHGFEIVGRSSFAVGSESKDDWVLELVFAAAET